MRRIIVHIDRLLLRGFRDADRHLVADGLRAELGLQLAAPEAAERLGALGNPAQLKAGSIRVAASTKPARIGAAAARAIGRRITS